MPTYPGVHTDFDINQYPSATRTAIRRLSTNFYVTRSFKPVKIGNSEYFGALVRPTDEFSIYINTDREILIVFAEYNSFEIRTLEAYEEFYELLESKRIDKSIRFLISADARIENTIKHYLDQNPEYPIIIPMTYEYLSKPVGNAALEAVRRNYILRDLFGYQNPLREETFFFGRQDVVNSVLDMAKSGQSSSLFGLRKSGKTSSIYAIQRKAKGFSLNVAVIDCQNPTVHARRYDSLLAYLLTEVRKSLGQSKPISSLGSEPAQVAEMFFQHMNSALGNAKNSILIIFDEIENISPTTAASPHWRDENDTLLFWQTLRSYIQSESKGRLSICIVGTSPQILETSNINSIANPIYLFAQKKFIPSLNFDETREMIERLGYFMGMEFGVNIISDIYKEYGGHPFFTRQVCSKMHQLTTANRPVRISMATLNSAKSEFYGQLENYLREIISQLRQFYPQEFDLLRSVIEGKKDEISEFGLEAPELIDHLIGYGFVERINDEFDIRFDAIRIALRNVVGSKSADDRWAEISRRRNAVEVDIRVAIYHWTKGINSNQWDSIVKKSLTNSRFEKLSSTEPRYLFSKSLSPLYLSDLLMMIKNVEVMPYISDRRSAICKSIDTLNKLRKDAHANELTDDEMNAAREAFDTLEAEFS